MQNDGKELCLFNLEEGTIVEKIFHVEDFKPQAINALGSAISKMTKISKLTKKKSAASHKKLPAMG